MDRLKLVLVTATALALATSAALVPLAAAGHGLPVPPAYAWAGGSGSCDSRETGCWIYPSGSHGAIIPASGVGVLLVNGVFSDECRWDLLDLVFGCETNGDPVFFVGCVTEQATTTSTAGADFDVWAWCDPN